MTIGSKVVAFSSFFYIFSFNRSFLTLISGSIYTHRGGLGSTVRTRRQASHFRSCPVYLNCIQAVEISSCFVCLESFCNCHRWRDSVKLQIRDMSGLAVVVLKRSSDSRWLRVIAVQIIVSLYDHCACANDEHWKHRKDRRELAIFSLQTEIGVWLMGSVMLHKWQNQCLIRNAGDLQVP